MNRNYLLKILSILFCIFMIACSGTMSADLANEDTNNPVETVPNDSLHPLQGTWVEQIVNTHPNEIDFDFNGIGIIRFRYTWGGIEGRYYTVNHSFRGLDYDEPTASFLTYHDVPKKITFTATVINDKLKVSGLRSFYYAPRTPSFPFERDISLTPWNGTYKRKE